MIYEIWPYKTTEPARRKKPAGVFVCDMSDLFGIGISERWTRCVMQVIRACPQHRFYLLTKQPQNLAKFSPFPDNCWVGVTATGVQMFINAGVYLQTVEAKVKFISAEPLLTWQSGTPGFMATMLNKWGINQVIIGAQTKPYKPPKIEWVEEIVSACDKAGVKVFLKDNLRMAGDISMQVHHLRQELPE